MTEQKPDEQKPSPWLALGLDLLGRMPKETKQAMVDTVANTLNVRPGFWTAEGEAPTENAAALLDCGEARYVVAYWNGTAWLAWKNGPGDADVTITQPVKRWAVIPG